MNTIKNNSNYPVLLVATSENIEITFNKIRDFANARGYRIVNALKSPTNLIGMNKALHFDSQRKKKVLRRYINQLDKNISLRNANQFLHFLFRKIYNIEAAPSVLLSEKEIAIQVARKAWKKSWAETEKLRLAYRTEKGDFYKQK